MTLEHWAVTGTWFAGITTLLVSCVALYLAHPVRWVRLGVKVDTPVKGYWCHIRIQNRSRQRITVTAIDWSIGRCWDRQYFHGVEYDPEKDKNNSILPGHRFEPFFSPEGLYADRLTALIRNYNLRTLRVRIYVANSSRPRQYHPGSAFLEEVGNLLGRTT